MAPEQSWTLPAASNAPVLARRSIRGYVADLRLAEDALADLMLCVSEAVTNAVQHAYRGAEEPGPVHVAASVENGGLVVCVRDEGAGMMPRQDSPGLGLGLPTISSLAEDVDIRADDRGTVVRMRFALSGGGGDP